MKFFILSLYQIKLENRILLSILLFGPKVNHIKSDITILEIIFAAHVEYLLSFIIKPSLSYEQIIQSLLLRHNLSSKISNKELKLIISFILIFYIGSI